MSVLTRRRWQALAIAEVAEESRVLAWHIRSGCQAAISESTRATLFPLLFVQKVITCVGSRANAGAQMLSPTARVQKLFCMDQK